MKLTKSIITPGNVGQLELSVPTPEIFNKIYSRFANQTVNAGQYEFLIQQLISQVSAYHEVNKKQADFLGQRVAMLELIKRQLNAIKNPYISQLNMTYGLHHDHEEVVKSVQKRINYLNKLLEYLNFKQDNMTEVVNMFKHQDKFNIFTTKADHGPMHTSLHQSKILEKLEPRHRFFEDLTKKLTNYILERSDLKSNPAKLMVEFFLKIETDATYKQATNTAYFTEDQTACHTIRFDENRAWTFYKRRSDDGRNEYHKYDTLAHPEDLPHLKPLQTLQQRSHTLPSETQENSFYPWAMPARGADPDLVYSYIYALRKGTLVSYPTKMDDGSTFHSYAFQGKKIESAGLLAALDGKIFAIDNRSGHYRPSMKLLANAVNFIHDKGAFSNTAYVGAAYSYSRRNEEGEDGDCGNNVFFLVDDFRELAASGFRYVDVWNKMAAMAMLYPGGPADFPDKYKMAFDLFRRRWADHRLNWDIVRTDFINYMYPGFKKYMSVMNRTLSSTQIPSISSFKFKTFVAFRGRGNLAEIDSAIEDFHRTRNELRLAKQANNVFVMKQKFQELTDDLQEIMTKTSDWMIQYTEGNRRWERKKAIQGLHEDASREKNEIGLAIARLRVL